MSPVPYALSIHHFINSVGADAGFAAIIGLAILVLLYFAQARETSSLREQAYQSAQRVQQLEARMTQLTRAVPAHAPAPRAAPPPGFTRPLDGVAPATAAPVSAAVVATPYPAAPAGVAAPALSAATRLIPLPAVQPPAPEPVVAGAPAAGVALDAIAPEDTAMPAPRPVTVAAANGANGDSAPAAFAFADPGIGGVQAPPPRVQIRPTGGPEGARRTAPPDFGIPYEPERRGGGRRIAAVIVGLLVAAAAVVLLVILTSGGSPSHPAAVSNRSRITNPPTTHRTAGATIVNPADVTVAVLNGTATNGLAATVSVRLTTARFKKGFVGNATAQTHTTTIVAYMPGAANRRAALAVAASLKLSPSTVQAVDQPTQQVACPPGTPCPDNVVVTVGSDLSST